MSVMTRPQQNMMIAIHVLGFIILRTIFEGTCAGCQCEYDVLIKDN